MENAKFRESFDVEKEATRLDKETKNRPSQKKKFLNLSCFFYYFVVTQYEKSKNFNILNFWYNERTILIKIADKEAFIES